MFLRVCESEESILNPVLIEQNTKIQVKTRSKQSNLKERQCCKESNLTTHTQWQKLHKREEVKVNRNQEREAERLKAFPCQLPQVEKYSGRNEREKNNINSWVMEERLWQQQWVKKIHNYD